MKPRCLCLAHKTEQIEDYDEDRDAVVVDERDCEMCERAFDRNNEIR